MFYHILVPVDFAETNRHALDIAVGLAGQSDGQISVLHVIELIADTRVEELKDFYALLEQQARESMEGLLAPYRAQLADISTHIVYGHRVRDIVRFASNGEVDLIVLNSHRIDPNDPTQGWGTISYKVGILAQCPVMLVK